MPACRTQAPSIAHRIPVVQPAICRQRLRFVARIDVRTVVRAGAAPLSINSGGARSEKARCPLPVGQACRNQISIGVRRCAQILGKPALVPDLNGFIVVPVEVHTGPACARTEDGEGGGEVVA